MLTTAGRAWATARTIADRRSDDALLRLLDIATKINAKASFWRQLAGHCLVGRECFIVCFGNRWKEAAVELQRGFRTLSAVGADLVIRIFRFHRSNSGAWRRTVDPN